MPKAGKSAQSMNTGGQICRSESDGGGGVFIESNEKRVFSVTLEPDETVHLTLTFHASIVHSYSMHLDYGVPSSGFYDDVATHILVGETTNTGTTVQSLSINVGALIEDPNQSISYSLALSFTFDGNGSCTATPESLVGGGGPATPANSLTGLIDRAKAFLHGLTNFAAEPVDVNRGALVESTTDMSLPVRGPSLDDTRAYDSSGQATDAGIFGIGWSSLWDSSLKLDSSWRKFTWREPSGASVWFTPVGSTWEPQSSGVTASLSSSSGAWTVRTTDGTNYVFGPGVNPSGAYQLSRVVDRNGYELDLTWPTSHKNGALTVVARSAPGASAPVAASMVAQLDAGGLATSIADSAGRTVSFGYAQGHLATASSLGGGQWQYGYGTSGRLTLIKDPAGGTLITQYYPQGQNGGRVQAQWDPNAVAAASGTPTDLSKATQFSYDGYGVLTNTGYSDSLTGTTTISFPDGTEGIAAYTDGLLDSYTQMDGIAIVASWEFDHDPVTGMISQVDKTESAHTQVPMMAMSYTAQGWLTDYFSPSGQTATYADFNYIGEPATVTRAASSTHPQVTHYTYDSPTRGNLVSVSRTWADASGASLGGDAAVTFHHADSLHPEDVTSMTAVDGTTTHNGFDSNSGLLTSTTTPNGDTTSFRYDAAGHRVAMVTPSGNVSGADVAAHRALAVTNAAGQPLLSTDAVAAGVADGFVRNGGSGGLGTSAAGDTWSTRSGTWTVSGGTASASPGLTTLPDADLSATDGYMASYVVADPTADQVGVAFRVQDALNYWDVVQVPGSGVWHLNKVINGASQQVTETPDPDNHISAGDHVSVYSIGSVALVYLNGKLLTSSGDGALATFTGVGLYSGSGTPSAPVPVAAGFAAGTLKGSYSHVWYDGAGRPTSTAGPALALSSLSGTSSVYDADGNQTAFTDANGHTSNTGWDSLGRMSWQSNGAISPQVGDKTTYAYDALGRVTRVQAPGKNPETTSYHFEHTQLPNGAVAWNSQVATKPDGSTVTTLSDGGGHPLAIDYSTTTVNPDVTYTWDDLGRLVGSTSVPSSGPTVSMTRNLDSLGDVLSETRDGRTVSYHYDANPAAGGDQPGRLASIDYPGANHTVTEGYTNGRWTSVTDWNNQTTTFDWGTPADVATNPNVVGQLKNVVYPNATSEARSFDADGQIAKATYTLKLAPASQAVAWPVTYGRTQGGALTSAAQFGATSNWTYDSSTQVKTQLNPAGDFAFSVAGRPTKLTGSYQAFDASGELCWTGATSGTCGSPPPGSVHFSYNENGERTGAGSDTYSYDPLGEMTESVTSAGTTTYSYAADGLRVAKSGSIATDFTWDTTKAVPQLIQDGDNYYIYGPGGMPVERVGTSETRYLMVDGTGSVALSTDSTGTIKSNRTFDAWGNVTAHTGDPVSLGWQSQYQDAETGFYYLRHRYYDPTTAQFTTPDPLVALTRSRYGYAANDPVNLTDPLGLYGYGVISDAFRWTAGGLGSLLNTIQNDFLSPIARNRWNIAEGVGIALGLASVTFGILALMPEATLGLGIYAIFFGASASALDYAPCFNQGVTSACAAFWLGTGGVVAGVAGVAGAAGIASGAFTADSAIGTTLTISGVAGLISGWIATDMDIVFSASREINGSGP